MNREEINSAIGEIVGKSADYFGCLNAMYEAEKALWDEPEAPSWLSYRHELYTSSGDVCHASARQRAEAFLKTIGRWKP